MKLSTPLKRHSSLAIKITQPYGNTSFNFWYISNGINIPFHNGIDLILDTYDWAKIYGSECVACYDGKIVKRIWDSPMSTKGNGITFQSNVIEEEGKKRIYQAVYWHLSEIKEKNEFKKGEVIGYIGNSGLVRPEPSPFCVWCGSHLHFMLCVYELQNGIWVLLNKDNGVGGAIDPLPYIEDLQGSNEVDSGVEKDLPAIEYFLRSLFEKIKEILK